MAAHHRHGDDRDRVLVRGNGEWTYFAADCAYYLDKRQRGFDKVVIMLGADHHGYIDRLRAMATCFGDDPDETLEILIGQLVNLVRNGEPVRMSKRAGNVIVLADLVDAIGVDAARYALVRYSVEQSIDIDMDLWARQTSDNPVYYVQYAHARLASLQRNAAELGIERSADPDLGLLASDRETDLLARSASSRRVVATAAELRAPHRIAHYLEALAGTYHRFYDSCRVLPMGDEPATPLTDARLWFCEATRVVLANGLACSASPPRSGCDRAMNERSERVLERREPVLEPAGVISRSAHPAGPRHADVLPEGHSAAAPADVNALDAAVWPASARRTDGVLQLGGVPVTELARQFGTPAFFLDEADLRERARSYADAFDGTDAYYAGKAFLCTAVARWVAEEGLGLDVCTGGELSVALAAGFPPGRIGLHGNNKSVAELTRAVQAGVGHIVVDSFDEIDRLAAIAAEHWVLQRELREASFALGITKWKTIVRVVLPTAFTGIITGVVLGVARVAGETAPLLILSKYTPYTNTDPFTDSQAALPLMIKDSVQNLGVTHSFHRRCAGQLRA